MKTEAYACMLIELDALLDTRLATLGQFEESRFVKALSNNYHTRLIDHFDGIEPEEFAAAYAKRGRQTLRDAIVTPVNLIAKDFALGVHLNAINSPERYRPKIYLNVYPYELVQEEEQLLLQVLRAFTGGAADLQIVRMHPAELTPRWVKQLEIMVLYDYDAWLKHHVSQDSFKEEICPQVMLIAPKISFNKPILKDVEETFLLVAQEFKPLINICFMDVQTFSSVWKFERKDPADTEMKT